MTTSGYDGPWYENLPPVEIGEDGTWWLGHASGFEVYATSDGQLRLWHRCGWQVRFRGDTEYVGNLVPLMIAHRRETCEAYRNDIETVFWANEISTDRA